MWRNLANAVRRWWAQDRIRASPVEGRMLCLRVPALVEVRGYLVELTRRVTRNSSEGNYIVYRGELVEDGSECEILVRPGQRWLEWTNARGTERLDERELAVFGPPHD